MRRNDNPRRLGSALVAVALFLAIVPPAAGLEGSWYWVGDIRAVAATGDRSWLDGGLGKTRYGDGDDPLRLAESHLVGTLELTGGLQAYAHVRAETKQKTAVDIIEAFVRWQPEISGDVPLTVKVGAFFPPVSLENEGLAWAGLYTITPSAINTWVGEELRTLGAEASWTGEWDKLQWGLTGAVFGWNDPAGVVLAYRGWALHDRWSGLIERTRLPDVISPDGRGPLRVPLFREIDNRPGWYAGASLRQPGVAGLSVLYYNNEADVSKVDGVRAWHTDFWSAGIDVRLAPGLQLLSQGMVGLAEVGATPQTRRQIYFQAAYVELGYTLDSWTFGARGDLYSTREETQAPHAVLFGEHGYALTAAVTRRIGEHVAVTLEVLHDDSYRAQRQLVGEAVDQTNNQVQTVLRVHF